MQEFYKKSLIAFICLVAADALLACIFFYLSYLSLPLLPGDGVRWHYVYNNDAPLKGTSSVRIEDGTRERLRFRFHLTGAALYPFVSAGILLDDARGRELQMDWTRYSNLTFIARCSPSNSMTVNISTFDEKVSQPGNFLTYRSPGTFFSCNEAGQAVSVDLAQLSIAQWWFDLQKLDLSRQGYTLNRVSKIVFGTTSRSPRHIDSQAEISQLTLHGRDYRYLGALALLLAAGLCAYAIWFFRAYTRALVASLDSKMKKDLPLVAYRQLMLEPYKDKEKASVMRFIANNYTNPGLDLEGVVNGTGANRNKVNEVLKTELGMTFTGFLNKLRLTEAARLLADKPDAAIAEVAYSVGYANVSYFNKLFKEEYDCTPKAFRSLQARQGEGAGCGENA